MRAITAPVFWVVGGALMEGTTVAAADAADAADAAAAAAAAAAVPMPGRDSDGGGCTFDPAAVHEQYMYLLGRNATADEVGSLRCDAVAAARIPLPRPLVCFA